MGKNKDQLWVSFKEWSIRVPQRWWDMINVPLSYIPLVVGVVGFLIWARNVEPPIPLWIVIIIPLGTVLFMFVSFLAFHRVRAERDRVTTTQETQAFSLVWLGEDSYWLRDLNGGHHLYDTTTEDNKVMLVLEANISVNTMKLIQVESISLDMAGTGIPSNWVSDTFYQPLTVGLRFDIPLNTQRGKRIAQLQAVVDGKQYLGEHITLDLPLLKQGTHK